MSERILKFTVDSQLLRELGERLVGKPHIALAELVKNSYDADASQVVIRFMPQRIEVLDDGHGMNLDDFEDKWLRIGSTHKQREVFSPRLRRSLTGSKGVGRLAVQLLANNLRVESVWQFQKSLELVARVDWTKAIEAGDLTEAPVVVDEVAASTPFAKNSPFGTRLVLTNLNHSWGAQEFEELARELWPLQSPFDETADEHAFRVVLESPYDSMVRAFNDQMHAVLDIWSARLTANLMPEDFQPSATVVEAIHRPATKEEADSEAWDTPLDFARTNDAEDVAPDRIVELRLEFADGGGELIYYRLKKCRLDSLHYEIRVFTLAHRQPYGIGVRDAREYLRKYGGVHIYDGGFNLPYYGPDADWLHIEIDHSHRLSRSRLLPRELQRPGGLSNLPTNSRLFGVVDVNTAHEQREAQRLYNDAASALAIQVSRDRLTETIAYRDLVTLVRWGLDYYAMIAGQRAADRNRPNINRERDQKPSARLERLQNTLDNIRDEIPDDTFDEISQEVDRVLRETQADEARYEDYLGILGALATAGISALAYEHEVSKQFEALEQIVTALDSAADGAPGDIDLDGIARGLEGWLQRARATHNLFSHLLQDQNRTLRSRFPALKTLNAIKDQITPINPGVQFDFSSVSPALSFPPGRYAEWSAIFQNLFTNAFNAMRASQVRRIKVVSGRDRNSAWLLVEDTGVGVDLTDSEKLFDPFVRKLSLGPDHASLALGGSGLGLTIVRMMAQELDCAVHFARPDEGYFSAVKVSWGE